MRSVFFLTIAAILMTGCSSSPTPPEAETVVMVHGLGRTPMSMALLGERLERAGFRVVNFGYPSRTETVEGLVNRLRQAIQECCPEDKERIHFVTHSMGGIIVRAYLAQYSTGHTGHVVMLSPPNQGSEIADTFADSPILSRLLGPAGSQLGTDSTGIAHQLGPGSFKIGIITGNLSLNPLGSWMIPGSDDGKVSIDRARLEGAIAFLVIPATHTFIMNRQDVAAECILFLREGRFSEQLASRFAH
ncbi:MAG: alpha/beta fold hydrolase [Gemmatimonadota bacterium]|nr:alpha/beta fold hydrolase [Gemmatimonadota bacterium]